MVSRRRVCCAAKGIGFLSSPSSAFVTTELQTVCLDAGCNAYLSKPFKLNDLIASIRLVGGRPAGPKDELASLAWLVLDRNRHGATWKLASYRRQSTTYSAPADDGSGLQEPRARSSSPCCLCCRPQVRHCRKSYAGSW